MNIPIYKIVVLGEGRVGKTSMSLKYVQNRFDDNEESSINASYLENIEQIGNGDGKVKLAIWDTAGQQKYNAIAPVYYRDAIGAIVVYQITCNKSFEKVKKWVLQLQLHGPKKIVITVAGNKSDMQNQRQVNHEQAQKFALQHNAQHCVVSAKNGSGIKEMFQKIAQRIYKLKKNDSKMIGINGKPKKSALKIQKKQQNKNHKNNTCCP